MSRPIFCRHCAHREESVAGLLPDRWPACTLAGSWTTEPVPTKPYDLNENDRRFLRAIKIEAD